MQELDIMTYNLLIVYVDVSLPYIPQKEKYIDRKISVVPVPSQPLIASQNFTGVIVLDINLLPLDVINLL